MSAPSRFCPDPRRRRAIALRPTDGWLELRIPDPAKAHWGDGIFEARAKKRGRPPRQPAEQEAGE